MNGDPLMEEKTALWTAGLQPQRFGFAVQLLRRLIWPLVRPYHYFHLVRHRQLLDGVPYASGTSSDASAEVVALRSEVAALVNRLTLIEQELWQHREGGLALPDGDRRPSPPNHSGPHGT